ncbi:hypothetical protein ATE48_07560 [Candidatus Viadribacter manganicus]|uniref:Uncharacterized protein n=1 Tax=Candidatus Viadribacter manganicus TaxID=1759059 RepID=A0A1B1AGV2_9PROT|nr:hypothetical protein ATE48_07560 [Candidatus Viadribacter manganicus]
MSQRVSSREILGPAYSLSIAAAGAMPAWTAQVRRLQPFDQEPSISQLKIIVMNRAKATRKAVR